MKSLTGFKAFYCSGIFIPDPDTITALSLLFEKTYLPNNIHVIKSFASKYRFEEDLKFEVGGRLAKINLDDSDGKLLAGLNETQKKTAEYYLFQGIRFAQVYKSLMPEIFESELLVEGFKAVDPVLLRQGDAGEKNTYSVSLSATIELSDEDQHTIPTLIDKGYIPVVGKYHPWETTSNKLDSFSSKQMAALLAMQSLKMVFPQTKAAHPEILLEARERLADYLPPFWSAMLKLSVELRKRIRDCNTLNETFLESQDLVDTIVMPALIDLQQKMIKEKKDWFYKILSPVQKGLRILVGSPLMNQQQLVTNALILGSDVVMTAADNMRNIEALKNEAGLTFLLEAHQAFQK